MKWFGNSWGAPACEPEDHVETPVGKSCLWCREPIEAGDQGFLIPHLGRTVTLEPHHLECQIRSIVGGLNHIEGRCSCHHGTEDPDPPGYSRRRAAVMAERAWRLRGCRVPADHDPERSRPHWGTSRSFSRSDP